MFQFQKHYTVHKDERERAAQAMCKLCEKLNEEKIEVGLNVFIISASIILFLFQPKSYDTLGKWWWGGGHCTNKVHIYR